MAVAVDAVTVKAWLSDGGEIALIDVREHGQFGEGHPFFAVSVPYSRLELALPALAPNPRVRVVLCDGGDGTAGRAAARAADLGYAVVHVMEGGVDAWAAAGYTLFSGVHVPSKTFGELIELERHTPRVTAAELEAMRSAGENVVIVDGRPFAEYHNMNIPGGICCPNGELALHIGEVAPDPRTRIVVNCAGRTRSIIGAQTLIDFGVPNPVFALENGTQGWSLADLALETGAERCYRQGTRPADIEARGARARALAEARGARYVEADEVRRWVDDPKRTTFVFDVRTAEEFAGNGVTGTVHAPGGQLVQATDRWIGVRGARIVVADGEEVRAPVIAAWLRQMGHDAHVLAGSVAAIAGGLPSGQAPRFEPPVLATIDARDLAGEVGGAPLVLDLRSSAAYRAGHIEGAVWSIRPRLASAVPEGATRALLVAGDEGIAALAVLDLAEAGIGDIRLLSDGVEGWRAGGLQVEATPGEPDDAERIDFLFFTHTRHLGDKEAARRYLAWETALVGQLDDQERASMRISPAP